MIGNIRPIKPPPPANSITPKPIGDTSRSVFPKCLNWIDVATLYILSNFRNLSIRINLSDYTLGIKTNILNFSLTGIKKGAVWKETPNSPKK
jgi:hypothetical protein